MDIKVSLNNLRIAPRKTREIADLIRGKDVSDAKTMLEFTIKKAAPDFLKLLKSAIDSALNNFKLSEPSLYIKKITVDEGPKLKRFFPMSRGRGYPIMKRTSHITLILSEKSEARNSKSKSKKEKILNRKS